MKFTYKKIADLCYIGVVCGVLFLPFAALPFVKSTDDSTENRTLAKFPQFKQEDQQINSNYFMELDAWFSDHFALRPQMVTAYGKLLYSGLHDTSNRDVILGKENWLYYADTADDAVGIPTISTNGAKHIANSLQLIADYAAQYGTDFIFVPAPNKASIYPQYLPNRYLSTGQKNNLDRISDALSTTSPELLCDIRGVLRNAADAQPDKLLYHKLDTHWNGHGAMLGFSAMMQSFQRSDHDFPFAAVTETQDWEGDLWNMLFPSIQNPDRNMVYDIPQTYEYIRRFRSMDDLNIQTSCTNGEGKLLMFRDSFGRAVIPLLSECFAQCTFIRSDRLTLDRLASDSYSHLICEIVERNLPQYLQYAPVLPAMTAEDIPVGTSFTVVADHQKQPVAPTIYATEESGYLHIYGTYHDALSDSDAVYCQVGDQIYHAFPCYEAELMTESKVLDNGFSLYLPTDIAEKEDSVRILVRRGDQYFDLGTNTIIQIYEKEQT